MGYTPTTPHSAQGLDVEAMEVICTLDVLQVRLALCVVRVRALARLRHSEKLLAEQILNDVWSGTPIFGVCHPASMLTAAQTRKPQWS